MSKDRTIRQLELLLKNLVDEVRHNLIRESGATNVIMPAELTSGHVYIEAEKCYIKNGKTKRKLVQVILARCPFCGVLYEDGDNHVATMGSSD